MVLIFLVLTSLMVFSVNFVNVCAVDKPSVPQFSVKFIDKSYDVPPTQTKDPYTGETTTQHGYRVNDGWLEVTIKNQPFTIAPHNNSRLYYLAQVKGHFGGDDDWFTLAPTGADLGYVEQSDPGYTVILGNGRYDSGVQLDFRVKAVIGYPFRIPVIDLIVEAESDWSNIQTITIAFSSLERPSQTANFNTPIIDPSDPLQQNLFWSY